jgi:hypothetical protein
MWDQSKQVTSLLDSVSVFMWDQSKQVTSLLESVSVFMLDQSKQVTSLLESVSSCKTRVNKSPVCWNQILNIK